MTGQEVLAVVVSFNGGARLRRTVEALRGQVGHVLIVDNGSSHESQVDLQALAATPAVTVTLLGANRGIGHALNRGVQLARTRGMPWLLTMDQDSLVDGAMISAYCSAVAEDSSRGCLAPTIRKNGVVSGARPGPIDYAITSGNLVRTSLFDEVGLYDEGFFIDCIDFDFSLRVRGAGHTLYRAAGALMDHELGEAVDAPGVLRRFYARHSPTRRYYMYRNFLYMMERHGRRFPRFIAKLAAAQVLLTVLIGVLDPRPLDSYRAIGRGLRDYLHRRSGPMPEAA